jgi:hypothetical protein
LANPQLCLLLLGSVDGLGCHNNWSTRVSISKRWCKISHSSFLVLKLVIIKYSDFQSRPCHPYLLVNFAWERLLGFPHYPLHEYISWPLAIGWVCFFISHYMRCCYKLISTSEKKRKIQGSN